jgi:hypothetical protein
MSNIQQAIRVPVYEEGYDESRSVSNDINATELTVGVTGTQRGMTKDQAHQLRKILTKVYDLYSPYGSVWLAHGDCIGVDAEAHMIAKSIGYKVRVHPPSNVKKRAYVTDADYMERPQIYSIRNHDIVRTCDYLIVVPYQDRELVRSGTWATCRYARQRGKPHTIIFTNGKLDGKEWQKILQPRR